MPAPAHRLERRAALLATRLKERADAFRDVLAPPGQRPPFATALPKEAALDWWTKHRYDDLGKQVLARYEPAQIAELDALLAVRNQAQAEAGLPIAAPAPKEAP